MGLTSPWARQAGLASVASLLRLDAPAGLGSAYIKGGGNDDTETHIRPTIIKHPCVYGNTSELSMSQSGGKEHNLFLDLCLLFSAAPLYVKRALDFTSQPAVKWRFQVSLFSVCLRYKKVSGAGVVGRGEGRLYLYQQV